MLTYFSTSVARLYGFEYPDEQRQNDGERQKNPSHNAHCSWPQRCLGCQAGHGGGSAHGAQWFLAKATVTERTGVLFTAVWADHAQLLYHNWQARAMDFQSSIVASQFTGAEITRDLDCRAASYNSGTSLCALYG
jgi:hypothetical protein